MKRFTSLLQRDFILTWRNGHVFVVIALAMVMIALTIFLPKELTLIPATTAEAAAGHSQAAGPGPAQYPVVYLREKAAKIPLNLSGIPMFLAFEAGILGFLLVAVFVFQEKQEGTINAYRTSPGGLLPYIASKIFVFTALGVGYSILIVLPAMGFRTNWAAIIALVAWAGAFMTLLGLGFAAWFDNLSQWFFPGFALLFVNILPLVSYVFPVLSSGWIRIIPSYGLIFSLREALFPGGNGEMIRRTLLVGLAWLAGAGVFCGLSVRAKLLKGAA